MFVEQIVQILPGSASRMTYFVAVFSSTELDNHDDSDGDSLSRKSSARKPASRVASDN